MILIKVTYSSTQPTIKVTYDVTNITVSGGQPSPVYVNLDYSASGAATNLTSVGLTMPTGFSVANSPLVQSGTLAVTYASGYSLPSDAEQATWDTAYNRSLTAANVSGTTTKTLTLTKQDGSTLQASWSDYDTAPVTSVFGRTGDVVATEGDYNLGQLGDVTITSPSTNQVLKYNGTAWVNGTDTDTGLTSVGISVPTGLTVSNSPLTSNGTIAINYGSGYSIPTDTKQGQWDQAYNDKINSASVTGTTTKTLTLTQQDGGTVQASWSDIDTGLTSVGLTMPAAFTVSNSPLTSNGTIAVTGSGLASQYVRGDGSLGDFPSGGGGGGASVSYYLNGSVNQGTIGGVTYYEMNKTPILGTGTNFTINGNGYIASFLTDANDPNLLKIPGGNWNFETFFSASSGGGNPTYYVELYKYDGTTFTLIASGSTNPDVITGGTAVEAYFSTLTVPETILTATERLAIRIYVTHAGRTITLHTEDNNLCQIITTFSTGINALNGLTAQVQYLATGTTGSDFNINSLNDTHTFNLPTASATVRGALASSDWTTFNNKIGVNDTIDCGTW
jgi:hypothetical protein